ncbi:MAG: alpha/beta hydrolase [Dehalococcoidia bacterium]
MLAYACSAVRPQYARRRILRMGLGLAVATATTRPWQPGRLRAQDMPPPPAGVVPGGQVPPPMPPNAQMQAILDQLAALGSLPLATVTPRQGRELPSIFDAVRIVTAQHGLPAVEPVGGIEHRIIPGGPGSDGTLIRIYAPVKGGGPFPVLLYFHHGGFVVGTIDDNDASARALVNAAGAIVISVGYRLAPEFPFPAAPEDALAAYAWALANVGALGGDERRIAVGGESAGGTLAAVVCLMARDRGLPLPAHQLLIYPASDFVNGANTPSAIQYADAKPLSRATILWFARYYLTSAADASNPYASPVYGALAGMPPATVITAEIDPRRDTGRLHAEALSAAGVPVVYRKYDGVTHLFFGAAAVLDEARQAVALAADGVRGAIR